MVYFVKIEDAVCIIVIFKNIWTCILLLPASSHSVVRVTAGTISSLVSFGIKSSNDSGIEKAGNNITGSGTHFSMLRVIVPQPVVPMDWFP